MRTKKKQEVLSALGITDALEEMPPSTHPDVQGWASSHHHYLQDATQCSEAPIIVEVGVWKGSSTIFMAELLRDADSEGVIVSIDTYLGSHIQVGDPKWHPSLRFVRGWPHLFYTFLDNVLSAGVEDYVVPLPLDSINAAELFASATIAPNVIHIDAGHDYLSVKYDLMTWFRILKPGGLLICDDYTPGYPGVISAVDEFRMSNGIQEFEATLGKCRFSKPNSFSAIGESVTSPASLLREDRDSLLRKCTELELERDRLSSQLQLMQTSRVWRFATAAKRLVRKSQ